MSEQGFSVDFIGIGAHRCGTTWIYRCLEEHPDICVSSAKEVEFFNTTQMFWRPDLQGTSNYPKGLEWYKSHFHHCSKEKIKGEFSPIYLYDPDVPERIFSHYPHVKLLTILRNPIERLYSHYKYTKLKGFYTLPETFEEVVEKEKDFIEQGFYYQYLKRYLCVFPRSSIFVMLYEDLEREPLKFIKRLYKFLGVDDDFVPSIVNKRVNTAGSKLLINWYGILRNRFKNFSAITTLLGQLKKTEFGKKMRDALFQTSAVNLGYGSINTKTRKYLREYYRNDISQLELFLGRDLSSWK